MGRKESHEAREMKRIEHSLAKNPRVKAMLFSIDQFAAETKVFHAVLGRLGSDFAGKLESGNADPVAVGNVLAELLYEANIHQERLLRVTRLINALGFEMAAPEERNKIREVLTTAVEQGAVSQEDFEFITKEGVTHA